MIERPSPVQRAERLSPRLAQISQNILEMINQTKSGREKSPLTKDRMSAAVARRWAQDDDYRRKMSQPHLSQHKINIGEGLKRKYRDDKNFRDKKKAQLLRQNRDPELRKRMTATLKARNKAKELRRQRTAS